MSTTPPDRTIVRPVRFTHDVPAMRAFLELLGLLPRIEAERGGWVDLVSDAGMVALHSVSGNESGARSGQTTLSFEVADAEVTCSRLAATGYDAEVVDEAYGRSVLVTDPLGSEVRIGERADDLYGYREVAAGGTGPEPAVAGVVPVRFTDDPGGYAPFLAALGLTGTPTPGYASYDAGGHGWVGLHAGRLEAGDGPGPAPWCALSLVVAAGAFDALERRLRAAGLDVTRREPDAGPNLLLLDPDGMPLEIHPLP